MNSIEAQIAIAKEFEVAEKLPPYHAVNALWVCLVKMANLRKHAGGEHEQIASFLRGFSKANAGEIVESSGLTTLLDMQPPLETFLAHPREKLSSSKAAAELARIRRCRTKDPKGALVTLLEVLQRIRDKREHGFKSPEGQRDDEILTSAGVVLSTIISVALKNADRAFSQGEGGGRDGG